MFQMRRLAFTLFLVFLAQEAGATQQPPKGGPKPNANRCTPKVVRKGSVAKPKNVQMHKGDKSTGYSPIIAFEILESGEVVNAHVKRSSGIADIDASALNSIKGMKYNSRPGCETVQTEADVLIHFY